MKAKRLIVTLAVCCLFWFNTGNAYGVEKAPIFRDIKGSFAEQSVIRLTKQGFIHGVTPDQFAPGQNVTRMQFTILIAKALGVQPYFPVEPEFTDIPPATLEQGYVEALATLGLVKGSGEKTFGGDSPIMRQDAAVILRMSLGVEQTAGTFTRVKYLDAGQISPYAIDSVAHITNIGWLKGSKGYFYPQKNLSRAEAAVLIDRLLEARREFAPVAAKPLVETVKLGIGQTKEIGTADVQSPIAFTPVIGMDDPNLYSVSSNGTRITGIQPGAGTLTVNDGRSSHQVAVEVEKFKSGEILSPNDGSSNLGETETELQVSYQVYVDSPDSGFRNTETKNYPGPPGGLLSKSDTWTGFYRQHGRDIIIDLGTLNNVSGISLEFMQNAGWGIYLPKYIIGSVSADGVSWYQLGRAYHGIEPSNKKVYTTALSLTFPSMTARYIKLSFPVEVFVFARHLEVKGGLPAEKPVLLAPVSAGTGSGGDYLQDSDIRDILLLFTGDNSKQQIFSGSDFLPLAAYVDRQGKIKGRMFDTMLFLPSNRMPCTREAWNSYLEDLFTPGQQLSSLEDTVARINYATGVSKKEKVILTLPYPVSSQPYFDEKTSFAEKNVSKEQALQNRLEAVKWYYGELMAKWDQAGFENLDLAGIYWYSELVDNTVYQETYLVQQVARMVTGNNQKFFWIPYYGALGYEEWESYGFTHVFLQPNYYSSQNLPEDRMDSAAGLAKKYGTGIELEFDNRILYDPYYTSLFYKELNKAHQFGLDGNTVNAYYAGTKGTLLDAVYSDFPDIRKIYDDLYRWISGTYE